MNSPRNGAGAGCLLWVLAFALAWLALTPPLAIGQTIQTGGDAVVPPPAPLPPAEPAPAVPSPLKRVVKELRSGPLLMHGNYCGIGNRPGAAPIDALDAACMRHDACTRTGKLPGCACNERLRDEAATIAQGPRTPPDIRLVASATASAMAVLICKTGGAVAVPIPLPR